MTCRRLAVVLLLSAVLISAGPAALLMASPRHRLSKARFAGLIHKGMTREAVVAALGPPNRETTPDARRVREPLGDVHRVVTAKAGQYRDEVGPWRNVLTILPRA